MIVPVRSPAMFGVAAVLSVTAPCVSQVFDLHFQLQGPEKRVATDQKTAFPNTWGVEVYVSRPWISEME